MPRNQVRWQMTSIAWFIPQRSMVRSDELNPPLRKTGFSIDNGPKGLGRATVLLPLRQGPFPLRS